jgi:non-specific serine/threonine protein kinase
MPSMPGGRSFARQVRDALAHAYDPIYLRAHPLAATAAAADPAARGMGEALQRALEAAIDALRPARNGPAGDRAHRLLRLRYLEARPIAEVQRALGLGRSLYFAEHARALAAAAAYLDQRWHVGVPAAAPPAPPGNLPTPLTELIGREADAVAVTDLIARQRLVTLSGPGGVGKTRLAVELATKVSHRFPDGAWFVDLAPLAEAAQVPRAVLATLGLHEPPGQDPMVALAGYLRARSLLLLLDNCEHLVGACAELAATVLAAGPCPRLLATSRERLDVVGEAVWPVPPLALPTADPTAPPDRVAASAAARLFAARARLVRPEFAVTAANAAAVAAVCRRLDGLPLALELAAARAGALTVEQIAARLDDAGGLLTGADRTAPPRHRTLRAAVDWSHDLLAEPERRLFRRLAIFAGGWTLDAAEAVCADAAGAGAEVLDGLRSLVGKSLVLAEPRGAEMRYRLLEPLRQWARERLDASEEADAVARRHAAYACALATAAEPALRGPAQAAWAERLEVEHDNLRAALAWAQASGDAAAAVRLAGALAPYWYLRGHLTEGRARLAAGLALPGPVEPAARARALTGAGALARRQGDYAAARALGAEALGLARAAGDGVVAAAALVVLGNAAHEQAGFALARDLYEQSLAAAEAAGDCWGAAMALNHLGTAARDLGDPATARARYEASLAALEALGDRWGAGAVRNNLGLLAGARGDLAAARALYAQSLAVARAAGDRWSTANRLLNLGAVAFDEGDLAAARASYAESLALARDLGTRSAVPVALERLAGVAAAAGQPARALWLAGAAAGERARLPTPLAWADPEEIAGWLRPARAALPAAEAAAAWAAGETLPIEEAVAMALAEAAEPVASVRRSPRRRHQRAPHPPFSA